MKTLAKVLSFLALIALTAAPIAYLGEHVDLGTTKTWMLAATVLWFATVPFWMGRSAE